MPALPKDPALRRRRNRTTTARTISVVPGLKPPALPKGYDWRPETVAWWKAVWKSPMAGELEPSDVHELHLLAALVDRFWRNPSKDMAAEIRLQRQCFGLTPIDRRRLQWEVEKAESAQSRAKTRRTAPTAVPRSKKDPRTLLGPGHTESRQAEGH